MTTNFTIEELTRSSFASRNNINNTPSQTVVANLYVVAIHLEFIRQKLGNYPIIVSSGYRSEAVNKGVGGVANSSHVDGLAVDIIVQNNKTTKQTAELILKTNLQFDQMIIYKNFIHLGFDPQQRNQTIWYC